MTTMDQAEIWVAVGLVLLVAEALAPGFFLMWLGLAAVGTGIVLLLTGWGLGLLSVTYCALALAGVAVALRLRRRREKPSVNTGDAGLVGRRAHALSFEGNEGRVRLGDSDWPARLPAGSTAPEAGTVLEVAAVDGMTLVVRPLQVAKA